MTERRPQQPVTRIRQELTPSESAASLVNRFLEEPDPALRFYTTAQRVVPLDEYRSGRYERGVHTAEGAMRKLAGKVILLAGPVLVGDNGNALRFSFGVDASSESDFEELTDVMNGIVPGDTAEARIYVDLLKDKIKHDRAARQEAGALLSSQTRHPGYRRQLFVRDPKLIIRDSGLHVVSAIPEIAAEE